MDRDVEHLRLLSIFHYVLGGIHALFACFGLLYVIIGLVIAVAAPSHGSNGPPPQIVGWLFVLLGGFFVLLGWAVAAVILYAGRCLAQRKHYTFCLVVAALTCLMFPFGTVLGIFTLIVLQRPRVQELFQAPKLAP
ncbi:MAG: hypothetical protein JWR69_4770 [Pedosphaera sp.]|nr:hypothetical protein [Pedosphaera sp.]